MLDHYKREHSLEYDKEHTLELNRYAICEKEKKEVVGRFSVIDKKDSGSTEDDCVGGGELAEATTMSQNLDEPES